MKELEIIKNLPANKETIGKFAQELTIALDEGSIDALSLLCRIKSLEKVHELIKKALDAAALKQAQLYPEKELVLNGVKFEVCESGVRWDFKNVNDSQYVILKQYQEEYNNKVKEKEDLFKTLKQPMEVVNEDDGEITKIYPAIRSSSTIVKTSFI